MTGGSPLKIAKMDWTTIDENTKNDFLEQKNDIFI